MGFQSSFNQALGTLAGAALGAKHIKGQEESIAEQKMQGKFNVEREVEREKKHTGKDDDMITAYIKEHPTKFPNMNEMMAARAAEALASETNSKKSTSDAVKLPNHEVWLKQYMDWYGVGAKEAMKAYDENAMRKTAPTGKTVEKVLSTASDELLNKEKYKYKGGKE